MAPVAEHVADTQLYKAVADRNFEAFFVFFMSVVTPASLKLL